MQNHSISQIHLLEHLKEGLLLVNANTFDIEFANAFIYNTLSIEKTNLSLWTLLNTNARMRFLGQAIQEAARNGLWRGFLELNHSNGQTLNARVLVTPVAAQYTNNPTHLKKLPTEIESRHAIRKPDSNVENHTDPHNESSPINNTTPSLDISQQHSNYQLPLNASIPLLSEDSLSKIPLQLHKPSMIDLSAIQLASQAFLSHTRQHQQLTSITQKHSDLVSDPIKENLSIQQLRIPPEPLTTQDSLEPQFWIIVIEQLFEHPQNSPIFFELLIERAPICLAFTNSEFQFTWTNSAFNLLFEKTFSQLKNKTPFDFFDTSLNAKILIEAKRALQQKNPYANTFYIQNQNAITQNNPEHLYISFVPLGFSNQQNRSWMIIAQQANHQILEEQLNWQQQTLHNLLQLIQTQQTHPLTVEQKIHRSLDFLLTHLPFTEAFVHRDLNITQTQIVFMRRANRHSSAINTLNPLNDSGHTSIETSDFHLNINDIFDKTHLFSHLLDHHILYLPDASQKTYRNHPSVVRLNIHSYLGIKLVNDYTLFLAAKTHQKTLNQFSLVLFELIAYQINQYLSTKDSSHSADLPIATHEQDQKLRAISQAITHIRHDIASPMGQISLVLSTLEKQKYQFEQLLSQGKLQKSALTDFLNHQTEAFDIIQQALKTSNDILESLSSFKTPNNPTPMSTINLLQLCKETAQALKFSWNPLHLLYFHIPENLQIYSSPTILKRVFNNLLINAQRHAFDAKTVHTLQISYSVSTQNTSMHQIDIIDDGFGFTPEAQEHLFEPFFTTKPDQGGHGLGLSGSWQMITQQLHGTIELIPSLKGSHIRIKLPMH